MLYDNTLESGAPLRVHTFLSTLYKINTGYYGGRADTRKPISHLTAIEELLQGVSGVEVKKWGSKLFWVTIDSWVLSKNEVNSWSVGSRSKVGSIRGVLEVESWGSIRHKK